MAGVDQFGDVSLTFLRPRREAPLDWQPSGSMVTHHFPGGSRTETQVMGRGVFRWELLVRFDDADAFQAFDARYLTRATMRVVYTASAYAADRDVQVVGTLCKEWDDVLLAEIDDVSPRVGGQVYCTATFERAVPS